MPGAMARQLPGEELEIVVSQWDREPLGDVYDIGVKLERRGVEGLALKVFEYVIFRYDPVPSDHPYDRVMGSDIYTRIGRLSLMREDYESASSALMKAIKLNPGDMEPRFYVGELLLAKGRVDAAMACFFRVASRTSDIDLANRSLERINQIFYHETEVDCVN